MATLNDFTAAFFPATAFYSGTGSSELVPDIYPVAINGRPYMLDMASNEFSRVFDARVRDSVDQSSEPGEASLNPQGLWRRSQSSWHYGAGQQYADTAEAEAFRFNTSKGIDPWTRGRISLLPDTSQVLSSANSNLFLTTADTRVYLSDGQNIKFTTDLSTFTTVTGTAASNIHSLASDGYHVFYSYSNGDIDQTDAGIGSSSAYITGIEAGKIGYVKGRLMVGGQAADKHRLWNITTIAGSSANNPSPLFSHPNTNFEWVGFAAGQNQIYCAGFAGNKSFVYKTAVKADGTSLDIPTVAAELPLGEIITAIHGYLGFVVIGLEDGLRFCSADDAGNLVVGPKIVLSGQVDEFAGIGRFIYFSYKNFDATSTGVGRLDISVFISTNQPAFASDLMVTGQGAIPDVHEFNNQPIFTVAGLGLYKQHATNLVSSGYLESGIFRWGVPDPKIVAKLDIRCLPLDGSVTVAISNDGGAYHSFNTFSTSDAKEATVEGLEDKTFEAEIKVTLNRNAAGTAGPIVTRFMARAFIAALRSQIFTVPLLMHHKLQVLGREYYQDVDEEMSLLRDLVDTPRVVTYQENQETFPVVVENVQFRIRQLNYAHQENDLEGTAIVVMRSIR